MYSLRSTKFYKGQRSVGMLGEKLARKVFHCAKLRDGTRDSVLALKITRSPPHAVLRRSRPF